VKPSKRVAPPTTHTSSKAAIAAAAAKLPRSSKAPKAKAASAALPKLRLPSADRERQIIEGAIAYFSEAGFSGQTRELSKRLGVTQPLLYRYFASKQALIERVYQTVFESRWNPAWIPLLKDRSTPLRDRLIEFYRQYSEATYRPEWIRIYMHAGLSDPTLNRRYIQLVRRELMPVYCRELRHECGLPDSTVEVAEEEIEFVWSLHGGIFYMAMRQHVYKTRINVDFMTHVALVVDNFLAGARTTYPRLVAIFAPQAMAGSAQVKAARKGKRTLAATS
jgi:AcrR family transcriptional regulator